MYMCVRAYADDSVRSRLVLKNPNTSTNPSNFGKCYYSDKICVYGNPGSWNVEAHVSSNVLGLGLGPGRCTDAFLPLSGLKFD